MTTLSRRATRAQQTAFRIISGACRDAAQAHPDLSLDPRMIRSISKRAVGTLSAVWPAALAAPRGTSDSGARQVRSRAAPEPETRVTLREAALRPGKWRGPLWSLHRALGYEIHLARHAGDVARAETLVEVVRCVARMIADEAVRG